MDIKKYENLSKAGKDSVKKYLYLLEKKEKKKFDFTDLFFFKDKSRENSEDNDSYIYHEDIFNKTYDKKLNEQGNERKVQIKSACSSLNKKKNTNSEFLEIRSNIINNNFDMRYDKYKYHLLHHNDNYDNLFYKRSYSPSAAKYQPKFEYTYRKLIYSIPFKKMSGRQNKIISRKFNEKAKDKLDNKLLSYLSVDQKTNYSLNKKILNESNPKIKDKKNQKTNKITKIKIISKRNNNIIRKDSSISNSSNNFVFTNNELNFIRKKIDLEKKQNNIQQIKRLKKEKDEKNKKINKSREKKIISPSSSPTKIISDTSSHILNPTKLHDKNNTNSNKSIILLNEENNPEPDINKSIKFNQTTKYKGINFKKMLSREYLDKITRSKEPMHPMITPNYSSIEPKIIMKVLYSKSNKNENKPHIIAYNNDYTYDMNVLFNKYNNHHYPRKFNLSKMCGRFENEKNMLPVFMLRSFDRNSIDNFNENSLKMNNFANGSFQEVQSSFNEKKTFNARLKLEEIKRENKIMEYNNKYLKRLPNKKIRYLDEKKDKSEINIIPKNTWWKNKLGEFYKKDYDELGNNLSSSFIGSQVDGVTFKIFKKSKYKNLLNKREKEIFSPF